MGFVDLVATDWLRFASLGVEVVLSPGCVASVGFIGGDRAIGGSSSDLEQRRGHGGVQVPQGECIL